MLIPLQIQFPIRYPRLPAIFYIPFSPVSKWNQSGTGELHDANFNDFGDHDFRANR